MITAVALMALVAMPAPQLRDHVVTGLEAVGFTEFESAILLEASASGIPESVAGGLVRRIAEEHPDRVLPFAELRIYLLTDLYRHEIPYPVSEQFLSLVRARFGALAVDTGFLGKVRTVDLAGTPVYRVGSESGVVPPRTVSGSVARYTEAARQARVQGTVLMKCVILDDGSVANCRVTQGLGYGLDESAVLAIQGHVFEPGLRQGKPVPVEMNCEMSFRLY